MPVLVFDLVAVTGDSNRLDSVFVRAPQARASVTSPGLVTQRKVHVPAPEGKESVWVEPGPLEVTVKSGGTRETLRLDVPDVETVYLSDLLGRNEPIPVTEVDRIWEAIRSIETSGGLIDLSQLTPEQRELLRGPAGPPGPPGKASFDYIGDGPPPEFIVGSSPGDTYLNRVSGDIYTLS